MVIKETRSDKIFNFFNYLILGAIFVVCLYPLWFIIIASISDPNLVNSGQVWFWPKSVSLDGYKNLLADDSVLRGYLNTLIYTVGGTLINLAVTLPAAYALSRKDFVGRKFFTLMFTFTMFFSGGLIPMFMTVKKPGFVQQSLGHGHSGRTSMTNIIISRSFFETNIPNELREAAEIDGCTNTRFFFRIVLPLSTAIIAVMTLFFAVTHWNGYFNALNLPARRTVETAPNRKRDILMRSQFTAQMLQQGGDTAGQLQEELRVAEQIKYALIVVASLPVMAIYPLVQKHFVKGVTVGAVKG